MTIIEIEIAIFDRKSNAMDVTIFWSKCDLIAIPYRPRGTGDRRRSQNGFYTPASSITQSVDEFISPRI